MRSSVRVSLDGTVSVPSGTFESQSTSAPGISDGTRAGPIVEHLAKRPTRHEHVSQEHYLSSPSASFTSSPAGGYGAFGQGQPNHTSTPLRS